MRRLFHTLLLCWAAACFPSAVLAQPPSGVVTLVVPFAPGGTADIVARMLANALTPIVGQQVIVSNKSGASGFIAAQSVANSSADGRTLLLSFLNMLAVSPQVPGMNMPIDPERELTPIVNVVRVPFILVANKNAPFNTSQELIEYAKAKPGALVYASSGVTGGPHLAAELFKYQAKVDLFHVPYRGGVPAVQDILAGNAHMIFGLLPELLGHLQAGSLKPIAMLSRNPSPLAPNVPQMTEALPEYDQDYWYSISGPANMKPETIEFWNRAVNQALQTPAMQEQLRRQALEPIGGSTEDFRATIAADKAKWGTIVRAANIRVE